MFEPVHGSAPDIAGPAARRPDRGDPVRRAPAGPPRTAGCRRRASPRVVTADLERRGTGTRATSQVGDDIVAGLRTIDQLTKRIITNATTKDSLMGTHATLDGLLSFEVTRIHIAASRRRARGDPRQPRLRQALHRPHGGDHLDGGRRLAGRDGAPVRAAAARPGDLRAALRAGDLRGPEGLPARRRVDLGLPAGRQRAADAALGDPPRPAAPARGVLHRVAAAAHRGRRSRGCHPRRRRACTCARS